MISDEQIKIFLSHISHQGFQYYKNERKYKETREALTPILAAERAAGVAEERKRCLELLRTYYGTYDKADFVLSRLERRIESEANENKA